MIILTMFAVLLFLLSINVPIAIGLAVTTIVAMVLKTGTSFLIDTAIVLFDGSMKFPLIAIPLFILAGSIMNSAGISRRLIAFASALVGFIKGGLSMINIATSMFFAEISGSAVADVAALGSILIPAMKKKGYPGAFAAAVTSSSASLAIIIPPSIPMIVYAVMSQSSVVQLFVAGIIPGVIGGFFLMLAAYVTARRKNFPVEETFNIPNVKKTAKDAALAFLLPVIILGGIFGGVVTATEGAGLAVVATTAKPAPSVAVTTPPKIPPKIITGNKNANAASFAVFLTLGMLNVSSTGKFLRLAVTYAANIRKKPPITPGIIPATNN